MRLKYSILDLLGKDFGRREAEMFVFFEFWKDFGRLGAEIMILDCSFGRILEGLEMNTLIFVRFWKNFGRREAEIFGFR